MAEQRDFIIQRYAHGNWPYVLGQRPFLARGPNFKAWAVPGSLERAGQFEFRPELRQAIERTFPSDGLGRESYYEDAVAEFLLRDGIVSALWVTNARSPVPEELRWDLSVDEVARSLFYDVGDDVAATTVELLSGMSGPEHFNSYVAEDALTLQAAEAPPL